METQTANVIPFPERRYQPDLDHLREIIGDDDDPAFLFCLIEAAMHQLRKRRGEAVSAESCQAIANALALIHIASGRMVGHEVLS